MSKNIAAASLTYGDRLHFLFQSIDRLIEQNFSNIYIYCNGISPSNYQKLTEQYKQKHITILFSNDNLGSAGGYYELIQHIIEHDNAEYVLLLDDDNLVPNNCYEKITNIKINNKELYYFHRPDRALPKIAKELQKPEYVLGSSNSFLGRDCLPFLEKNKATYQGDLIAAPYGGLLLSRQALNTGILPIKELYLYADDYEYTHRLVSKYNFKIIFSEALLIEDLEKSFHLKKGSRLLNNRYSNASDIQLYYSVRNNTWLGLERNKSIVAYLLNVTIFTTVFSIQFLLSFKVRKVKTFIKAVCDGFTLSKKIKG
jgi:GT2 family glycosyltransferase